MSIEDEAPQGLFIGGAWTDAAATFKVTDPATGEVVAEVADATGPDAVRALDAAAGAQATWAATAPRTRAEILRRAFELMTERAESLARLATVEMGRPLAESRAEVAYAADFLRWFAEEAVRIGGDHRVAPTGDYRIVTARQPVGPCYLITPWNFPLAMVTRKVAPALAAGCTMVLKPAEATPLSALRLAELLADAGVPDGVFNVIPTLSPAEVTGALLADGRLRKLSFTGSTEVGRRLLAQSAPGVLRTSMELGGNAPFLVLDDADVAAAVEGAMVAKMRNAGQSCVAANRFLVHAAVADEFTEALRERLAALRTGPGLDPGSQVGPLIDAKARDKVGELVADAERRGAKLRLGGRPVPGPGSFYPPTLLTGVPEDAPITQQEIFGPVAAIAAYDDEQSMVAAANATSAGLVAFVYTRDLDRALRVGDALEAGMVGINRGLVSNAAAPFGGIKQSGLGREGGLEGIDEYLEVKYLAIQA
ncbi:NAD-dependent succinate-semialdehyde dehydrogenase [Actinomadura alba]|uniref:NAD-dependent succinate-semialdehyde dehydrogenase n=1 Tax=Actinomadura alba TaxID=406431 RepID=A0ABR7LJA9_9ACTN|nr:NAD-dependent succinate-semialdehyde dehydrogenase [Actinomadura alba]MBC6464861.1 NAD-dependent succinate-semialdehyde dehydrogenase [Actinomadura alba]